MRAKPYNPHAESEFTPPAAKDRPLPDPTDPPSVTRNRMVWPYTDERLDDDNPQYL